mmetsp:Transcript_3080/g.6979  ORF Transcript_3080/g.6979 Transcript_3080/m.6979 type:complete len:285 (-) Transcript_3080:2-856(-)
MDLVNVLPSQQVDVPPGRPVRRFQEPQLAVLAGILVVVSEEGLARVRVVELQGHWVPRERRARVFTRVLDQRAHQIPFIVNAGTKAPDEVAFRTPGSACPKVVGVPEEAEVALPEGRALREPPGYQQLAGRVRRVRRVVLAQCSQLLSAVFAVFAIHRPVVPAREAVLLEDVCPVRRPERLRFPPGHIQHLIVALRDPLGDFLLDNRHLARPPREMLPRHRPQQEHDHRDSEHLRPPLPPLARGPTLAPLLSPVRIPIPRRLAIRPGAIPFPHLAHPTEPPRPG